MVGFLMYWHLPPDTTPFYPLSPAAHAALGYVEVERYFRKDLLQ